jgi:hypothetical protein
MWQKPIGWYRFGKEDLIRAVENRSEGQRGEEGDGLTDDAVFRRGSTGVC